MAEKADIKKEHQEKIKELFSEVSKIVVGQEYMINRLLIGLFTQGSPVWPRP
jgi:MoxR-like ATPase